jgi:hypothetical protein
MVPTLATVWNSGSDIRWLRVQMRIGSIEGSRMQDISMPAKM